MLDIAGDLCGYVYISSSNFSYYCAICENIFNSSEEFQDHTLKDHFQHNSAPTEIDEKNYEFENIPSYNTSLAMETLGENDFKDFYDQEISDSNETFEENSQRIHLKIEPIFNDIEDDFQDSDIDHESSISTSIDNYEENEEHNITIGNHFSSEQQPEYIENKINKNWLPFDLNDLDKISFKCRYCKKKFNRIETLTEHTKQHLNFTLTCNICGKHSIRRSHAEIHKQSHCNKKQCKYCHLTYSTEAALELHLKRHERLICKYCSKVFKNYSNLQNHVRIHTGEKPFKCEVCGHAFAMKRNLQSHIISQHTGDIKNFSCEFCERKFKTNRLKDFHTKRVHLKEKPNQCEFCGINFANTNELNRHKLNLHSEYDKRPYHCTLCEKKFIDSRNLSQHINTHTGEKPFKCDICLKGFAKKGNLRSHIKIHSNKRTYQCKLCSKSFVQYATLNNHMKQYHLVCDEK